MLKLLDFYADWCGPCQTMLPIMEGLEKSFAGKIEILKINVDTDMETAQKYAVMSIPTFVVEKDGKEMDRKIGAVPKKAMGDWLNSLI
ncbi:thioredoxin [candidate division WWE3 bacterium CG09_land_8_20_14_0_10_39_24]|uniref:Thioredoxin n=2 Tax=Katanobacteria TaxID=422282 RepID=A0A2G9XBJ1_UNCKA|nr:MAG: thioredoxin [bacterium CG2_30_40_12]OJI08804.1 MAG: thioredoxin [bacterium CG09_39_24]PIP04326.1 MAG: thioredoxin [candidate division WWE3 bacterium CG23_combo_of_CG06-09_8_20_14_all_40_14]PIS12831.1 MAG: thioredoxin [candidate division WWE3 bacterium CG09_land_8_20_14_0_10_39_24]PJE50606.1 MAG: thioredoxin [candidate division WWE3 bacterium CG10_big_fil_rev_8_21_14_0_10_39_14]